jgi:tripartite-type tricarboxylate transporter receptor subunit TctC
MDMHGYRAAGALALLLAIAVMTPAPPARAQAYPERPVKLVTQGAAGSGPDVIGRIVTDHLSRLWRQQIVIINQPGAGGSAAAKTAAAASPDGYTLYMAATSTFLIMPEIFPNLPIDLERDFVRIGLMGEQPMIFGVAPSLRVTTLPQLIALAKAKPGEILYAANSRGTLPHLTAERLRKETGAEFSFIPYPGAAAGLQDLMGGRISMIVESIGALSGGLQGGAIKAVAVASPKRLPNFPDLPAAAETVPGFEAMGWFALMAPAGTPEPIVRQVNKDLATVLDLPELRKSFQDLGTFVRPMSPDETTKFIRGEQQTWRPIVRSLNLAQQ